MPFIADGVRKTLDVADKPADNTNAPNLETTIECELPCPDGFGRVSVTAKILETESKTSEIEVNERVRLIYNPFKGSKRRLLPCNGCSVVISSISEENVPQIEGPESFGTLITSTPFVKGRRPHGSDSAPFSQHDISGIALSPTGKSKVEETADFGFVTKEYSSVEFGKEDGSPLISSGAQLDRDREPLKASQSNVTSDSQQTSKLKVEISEGAEVKRLPQGHPVSGNKRAQLGYKKRRTELETELSNVRKMREKFSIKCSQQKRNTDSHQTQERASELRLLRIMRGNSLKEMEIEEKENLKRKKSSDIAAELENVRRIRASFRSPEGDDFNQYSAIEEVEILKAGDLSGDVVSPSYLDPGVFRKNKEDFQQRTIRSVTDEELDMVRSMRSKLSSGDEENAVFEDSSQEISNMEGRHEVTAMKFPEKARDVEAPFPSITSELDWIRYCRPHAECSPQKPETDTSSIDSSKIEEIRHLREGHSPGELMAERRVRAEFDKRRADELEEELTNVRSARRSLSQRPFSQSDNYSSRSDLDDVRKLKRTSSLGGIPEFTGEGPTTGRRSKAWVFGGVNILPHREVVINIDENKGKGASHREKQQGSEKYNKERIISTSNLEDDGKKRSEQNMQENQGEQVLARTDNQESVSRDGNERKRQIRRGYTVV